ncbi:MAG: glycosyltransferase, partial [Lachnospiraceae bacterium]|nr:glycosyltransferase [Lachnospiraceae bacterium]
HGAGVNVDEFSVLPYVKDCDTTNFLFVGRVMHEKGIAELLEAMKMLLSEGIKCHLDVLGWCEEDYTTILEKYQEEGWLSYHGYQANVVPFIEKCHCLVLPSWHEGMANTNLECASSGRPVITTNIHGCLEAVDDGISGFLVEKQNATSLYNAMKKFCMLNYDERRKMGLFGRTRMEKIFDKKIVVAETIKAMGI